jgi:hypothetical protein
MSALLNFDFPIHGWLSKINEPLNLSAAGDLSGTTSLYPYITQYKIMHIYDNSSKAEYYQSVRHILDNGGQTSDSDRKITKIKSSDIGVLFTGKKEAIIPYFGQYAGDYVVTFEYDWYTSKKPVQVPGGPTPGIYVDCRMKYSNEWYQRFYVNHGTQATITSSDKEGIIKVEFLY